MSIVYSDENYLLNEIPISKELKSFFFFFKPKVIFDVGSCDGLDSIKYSRLFPKSVVHSFEPLVNNVRLINNNLMRYQCSNVKVVQIALSEREGEANFYVSSGRPHEFGNEINWNFGNKSSSLLQPHLTKQVLPWLEFNSSIKVNTNTLYNYLSLNKISKVDFLHMDVQGAELMVLTGASTRINDIKMIWLEVENMELYKNQPLKSDVESFLNQNGFHKIKDTVNAVSGDQLWVNYYYFPRKKVTHYLYRFFIFLKKQF
jgi:FkbM family methyltransferase